MIKGFCDRCEKEIKNGDYLNAIIIKKGNMYTPEKAVELCNDCNEKLKAFLLNKPLWE